MTSRARRAVARQWLARYGVVCRDWWRRERPAVAWRAIYHELKRLEFRGEVRRGYFVAGLPGRSSRCPRRSSCSERPLPRQAMSPNRSPS